MDDQTWEFFLNNSPKLVKKKASKASFMKIEKLQELECSEAAANSMIGEKFNKKVPHRIKSTSRTIYRDITPISISAKNECAQVKTDNKKFKVYEALPRITQNQFIKFPGLIKRKVAGKG